MCIPTTAIGKSYSHPVLLYIFGSFSSSRSGSTQYTMDHDWLYAHTALGSCSSHGDRVKGHWIFGRSQFAAKLWFIFRVKDDGFHISLSFCIALSYLRCCWRGTATMTSTVSWPTRPLWRSAFLPMTTISFRSRPWVRAAKVWVVNLSTSTN